MRDVGIWQFCDHTGLWHLYGRDWFAKASEHVTMAGE